MDNFTQKLIREIAEKNSLLNSFDQNYDSNRESAESIKVQLDSLLYQYYKTLRYADDENWEKKHLHYSRPNRVKDAQIYLH